MLSVEFYREISEHPIPARPRGSQSLGVCARSARLVRLADLSLLLGQGCRAYSAFRQFWIGPATWLCGVLAAAAIPSDAGPMAGFDPKVVARLPGGCFERRWSAAGEPF